MFEKLARALEVAGVPAPMIDHVNADACFKSARLYTDNSRAFPSLICTENLSAIGPKYEKHYKSARRTS